MYYIIRELCFFISPYDKSHFSYGIIIAGMTGYGKSATWKELESRMVDFGIHVVSIDFKPRGLRGEYAAVAEAVGGVSYSIAPKSKVKLNLFDLSEQTEYDENSGSEYRTLRLYDKIESTKCVLMTIATGNSTNAAASPYKAETIDRMETIVRNCIRRVYDNIGLIDGAPDTLYESAGSKRGSFAAGRRKKAMPISVAQNRTRGAPFTGSGISLSAICSLMPASSTIAMV